MNVIFVELKQSTSIIKYIMILIKIVLDNSGYIIEWCTLLVLIDEWF